MDRRRSEAAGVAASWAVHGVVISVGRALPIRRNFEVDGKTSKRLSYYKNGSLLTKRSSMAGHESPWFVEARQLCEIPEGDKTMDAAVVLDASGDSETHARHADW